MPTAYRWHPITDLDDDWMSLSDGELEPLKRVWDGQKPKLIETGAFGEFDKQLRREWAIETGIIENVYTLDRGVTQTLIERGIDAALIPHGSTNRAPELVARIIQDHYDALDGMFDFIAGHRSLSAGYIKELHAALLRNQETYAVVDQFANAFERRLDKGKYKSEPNSPIRPDGFVHEYCPPEHVASEMDRLVELHAEHESRGVPTEIEAAWLHHRFAQIHPFADGNGRVARALASLVFLKAGWFPLIVRNVERARYIGALEDADSEQLGPLVRMFVETQRNVLIQIIQHADVRPGAATADANVCSADQAIAAARDVLFQRGTLELEEWGRSRSTAQQLWTLSHRRLNEVSSKLASQIKGKNIRFNADQTGGPVDGIAQQVVNSLGHQITPQDVSTRVDLDLNTGQGARLTLLFYAIGRRFRGIIAAVAFFGAQNRDPLVLENGTFQINYEEDPTHARERFSPWLERMIVEGLNEWRRTL
jgi:fido (protein-threonine AMPylation protein)